MERIQEEQDFLESLVEGIAAQFGEQCEVVLHDLNRSYESTIVAISNGHITGRKVGDPGTNLGLELLRGTTNNGNRMNYITQTKDGRILRSTSLYMKNKEGKSIGALCINFDITTLVMAERTLQSLTAAALQPEVNEAFVTNVNDLLDMLIQETQEVIGKPVAVMSKDDKMKFISLLDQKGAFLIKKAGDKISTYLSISKFTMYNYLEESKQTTEAAQDRA
ncbi:helix-turn-helix transcriptional regulator [Paenibacillus filicis]|uniref:Helix-turn-helix transcriptional regulator n=1 Tax=Paenibacillus filicis TaxID=669464 RepID=A0ABU9DU49_9BACL